MDDSAIVSLFLERNEEALTELQKKYGASCLRVAQNVLGSREDAEEVVSDACMRVWASVPPARPRMLGAYFFRIARNLALNRAEHDSAARRNAVTVCLEELKECLPAAEGTEETASYNELTRELEAYVRGLDKLDRVIFVRRYWFMDPAPLIARELGLSPAGVRKRLQRVRQGFKKTLIRKGFYNE